jgi:hypothetical protein
LKNFDRRKRFGIAHLLEEIYQLGKSAARRMLYKKCASRIVLLVVEKDSALIVGTN